MGPMPAQCSGTLARDLYEFCEFSKQGEDVYEMKSFCLLMDTVALQLETLKDLDREYTFFIPQNKGLINLFSDEMLGDNASLSANQILKVILSHVSDKGL